MTMRDLLTYVLTALVLALVGAILFIGNWVAPGGLRVGP